ncbi:hypothetical protein L914_02144, partial [Phytophthora nicotianae]
MSDSDSDSSSDMCGLCGGTPCDWEAMRGVLIERGDKMSNDVDGEDRKK